MDLPGQEPVESEGLPGTNETQRAGGRLSLRPAGEVRAGVVAPAGCPAPTSPGATLLLHPPALGQVHVMAADSCFMADRAMRCPRPVFSCFSRACAGASVEIPRLDNLSDGPASPGESRSSRWDTGPGGCQQPRTLFRYGCLSSVPVRCWSGGCGVVLKSPGGKDFFS